LGGRGRWISEFEASLVYKVSSRTARATQKNPVLKNQKKKKKKRKKKKPNPCNVYINISESLPTKMAASNSHLPGIVPGDP
jgi:hypothetical protein